MLSNNQLLICASLTLLLSSCGAGFGSASKNTVDDFPVLTGAFIGLTIEGLGYKTISQSGMTNDKGEFKYRAGERVTFSIGALEFPEFRAKPEVSPRNMDRRGYFKSETLQANIARLLVTLDRDGDPNNGVVISTEATINATALNFEQEIEDFETDPAVLKLVSYSGSVNKKLVSIFKALSPIDMALASRYSEPWWVDSDTNNRVTREVSAQNLAGGRPLSPDQFVKNNLILEVVDGQPFSYQGLYSTEGDLHRFGLVVNAGTTIRVTAENSQAIAVPFGNFHISGKAPKAPPTYTSSGFDERLASVHVQDTTLYVGEEVYGSEFGAFTIQATPSYTLDEFTGIKHLDITFEYTAIIATVGFHLEDTQDYFYIDTRECAKASGSCEVWRYRI